MERRVLVAVVLSFFVLYAYQALFVPTPPAERATAPPGVTPGSEVPIPGLSETVAAPVAPEPTLENRPAPLVSDTSEKHITVETRTVQAVFTNRGGRLKHWRLKDYLDGDGKPIDLVPSNVPPEFPLPFSLRVQDAATTGVLNSEFYQSGRSGDVTRIDVTQAPAALTFDYENEAGLRVRKEFRFEPDSYVLTFSASVVSGGTSLNPEVDWGPGLGDIGAMTGGGSFFTGNLVQKPQGIYHNGEGVERVTASDADAPIEGGVFRFAGIDDHYFIAAVLNPGKTRALYQAISLPAPGDEAQHRELLAFRILVSGLADGARFYVGPKSFDVLKAADPEFVRAINFGIFAFLVVPLLGALNWIYAFAGNYGVAIVVLTLGINLVMFPLRHKTVVSMRKMQELQPQLKAIQDRYKDMKVTDPARQKMNGEIMGLYREKGANPASGCLPVLLTMPVLFSFYNLLSQAIELRGADFGLWIHDLSMKDPYYITPLMMGATMFWQQKITPSAADPAQQRIMLFMPVVFTGLFLQLPSGLAIYYFVSNLWNIGQQYFTNWLLGPPQAQVVRLASERRVKTIGAGRSPQAQKKT